MLKEFECYINDHSTDDYWYDVALDECLEMLNCFSDAECEELSEMWQKHILNMCDEVDFPIEEVYRTMYAYKPDLERKQVKKDLASLIPCRENAFLFNKRYHDLM